MLASLLYPYDVDAGKLIDGWLVELETKDHIRRYSVDGHTYLEVLNWLNHQKIDRPSTSKLPPFDESSRILAKVSVGREGIKEGKGIKDAPSASVRELYEIYPRHEAPKDAYRAIEKALKIKTVDELKLSLQHYKEKTDAEHTEIRFIPLPASWFNAGRYDDDMTPHPSGNGSGFHLDAPKQKSQYEIDRDRQFDDIAAARKAAGR